MVSSSSKMTYCSPSTRKSQISTLSLAFARWWWALLLVLTINAQMLYYNCHVFSILLFSQTWKNLVILKKNWHVKNMSYTFLTLLVHLPTTYIHISPLKFSLSSCLLDFLSEKKVSYMQAILMTWMFNGKKALLAKLAFWMVNFLLGTIVERGNEEAGKA